MIDSDKDQPEQLMDQDIDEVAGGTDQAKRKTAKLAAKRIDDLARDPSPETAKVVAPTPGFEGSDFGSGG